MMSGHKLTAGDGYLYLIRQVAAADGTDKGRTSLSSYYSEKGESPGRWIGRGMESLTAPEGRNPMVVSGEDLWTVERGSEVTEDQMKAIFGLGLHPNAAALVKELIAQGTPKHAALEAVKLGRPFHINDGQSPLQKRLAIAYRDHNLSQAEHWNAPIAEEIRAKMRTAIATEMFTETYGRPPAGSRELAGFIARETREKTTSVAGYDFTFTPHKSASVLWAVAPRPIAKIIEECHQRAVNDALAFMQDNAAFTRIGTGGVAQIDTEGFIAAAFTHRDSRAGDPNLHTHVAVSGKVRATGADGIPRWLALDGRPIFKSMVAASEVYNTRFQGYMIEGLPIGYAERKSEVRGKRPVREIVGIPDSLIDLMSSRRAAIQHRYYELAKQFQRDHGREPTTPEAIALSQRATLETRQAKHEPRSHAEQRQQWHTQVVEHLGGQDELTAMLANVLSGRQQAGPEVTAEWINDQAAAVIEVVSGARSTWQRTHVYAEALRIVRKHDSIVADHTVADAIAAAALSEPHSVAHARDIDADLGEPEALRRADGASVYSTHGTALFTSPEIKAAERRIIAFAQRLDGRRVSKEAVELALLEQKARGQTLNDGQEALVRNMASSGARLALALAPGGTGKTTAMATLARAWMEEGGNVIGLSPSASAAQILRNDMHEQGIEIPADTVDKLLWLDSNIDAAADDPARTWFDTIGPDTLLIIDEAGKTGTLALDTVKRIAEERGASIRTIGDDRQLASISAGGILRDVALTAGSVTLTEVMRFRSRAEAAVTLALRDGDPTALAYYADNNRIHVASEKTAADTAFERWRADLAKGWDSLLLAPTNETVAELNERARLERLDRLNATGGGLSEDQGEVVELSDGLHASVGDVVATRENNRRLRLGGGGDFVRNGYRWTVTKIGTRGSLTVSQLHTNQTVTLPGWYVRQHVTLGYAATIDTTQGATAGTSKVTGTCHIVGSETLTRQQLYVAASRAKDETHIYLSTAEDDPHRVLTTKALHPDTALDVLTRVLARDGAQRSATTEAREVLDPFHRLGAAADRYADALGTGAEHLIGTAAVLAIESHAAQIYAGLTEYPAWPVLRKHLALLQLMGNDPHERLTTAINERELDSAADVAAVLDWRLDHSGQHSTGVGPLRWLPSIPQELQDHPEWGECLSARAQLVSTLAESIRTTAKTWDATTAPAWARPLIAKKPGLVAELAVFRAANNVDEADTRVAGPPQYQVRTRHIQRRLETSANEALGLSGQPTGRWNTLVDEIDPRVRRDPYWPQLSAHLSTIERTGVDLRQLLTDAAAQGPLPDEMPGAALWWRLSGTLTPAALELPHAGLRPAWLPDLHTIFGSTLAEAISGDPAFPGLVAAINAADPARWTPSDLLHVAREHLLDTDHQPPLRADEHARLLTYSIDLFTPTHPFDHIPAPAEQPPTPAELEELLHHHPDPHQPQPPSFGDEHVLDDDDLLERLGYIELNPADLGELLPPDPLDELHWSDAAFDGLSFDDLATERPVARPLAPALANVAELRTAWRAADDHVQQLKARIDGGQGPAVLAAAQKLSSLAARADADRPYQLAVLEVVGRWKDAEATYEEALQRVSWARDQIAQLQADPGADPLDLASAQAGLRLATMALPATSPAQRFQSELAAAIEARAHAAGGADKIVTREDVDRARREAEDADRAALQAALAHRRRISTELDRAESSAAAAFAEAHTRSAEHIVERMDALRTELSVLRSAGDYDPQRSLTLSPAATEHLPPLAARSVTSLGANGFTLTPVHAGDRNEALAAMSVLHAAAAARDRKVLWCQPTDSTASGIETAEVADTIATVEQTQHNLTQGTWKLPANSFVVIDQAADVEPSTIADITEHAARHGATVLLLDSGETRWPPPPSSALLKLLHEDLPWSATLSVEANTAPQRPQQLDLQPVLDQAAHYNTDVLPPEVCDAIDERQRLREAHRISHRVHNMVWRTADTREHERRDDRGMSL